MPEGGNLPEDEFDGLAKVLSLRLDDARKIRQLAHSSEARDLGREMYPRLTDDKPGMYGAVTSRAEAQVLRMSIIYALLDGSATITTAHLRAALDVWQYCEASARFIFGDKVDNQYAEAIRIALAHAGENGMTRKELSGVFSNHLPRPQMEDALNELGRLGLAHVVEETTAGRPASRWFSGAKKAN